MKMVCLIVYKSFNMFLNMFFFLGWLFKLELSSPEEIPNLMTEEQYAEFIKQDHS